MSFIKIGDKKGVTDPNTKITHIITSDKELTEEQKKSVEKKNNENK